MSYRFCLGLLIATWLFGTGAPAFALMIGSLETTSYLGEPLHVRIEVFAHNESALQNGCFRLAGPSSHRAPLNRSRLQLESIGGRHYVAISTSTPVDDPILDLSLRAENCGPDIQKEFVVLLSPKSLQPEVPESAAVMPSQAANSTATAVKPAARPVRPRAQKQASHRLQTRRFHPRHHDVRSRHHHRPRKIRSHFMLRLDDDVDAFAQSADQLAIAKVPSTETSTGQQAQVKTAAGGDRLVLQPLEQGTADLSQANATAAPSAASAAQPKPGNNVAIPAPAVARPATVSSAAAGKTGAGSFWQRHSFTVVYFFLLVLLLVLMVVLLLKRRPAFNRFESRNPSWPEALSHAAMEEAQPSIPPTPQPTEGELPEVRLEDTVVAVKELQDDTEHAADAAEERMAKPSTSFELMQPGEFSFNRAESISHILEMAEVMLAFGQSKQAIDILSQFIANNPVQSVEPWIKLLELYYQSDLREEFDALALDLHKRFNVAIPEWTDFAQDQSVNAEKGSLTLDSLPHIMERLTSNWGTPECLGYLDKLIADNRGGQRQGFSLPLVRDILWLREILRQSGRVPLLVH